MDEEKNRVTEWYNSWLNNRKPIFIKNRKSIGLNPEGTQEMINGQINRIKTTPLYIDNDVPDSVYDSLKTPLSLLYGKNTTKNSLAQDYKDTNIYGVSSFSGEGPFMYFPDNSSKKQLLAHEATHTSKPAIQEAAVRSLDPKNNLKNADFDEYLDSGNEIYARRNLFIYNMNLNPNKRVKRRDIRNWRKQDPFMFNIDLGRYKNKFIKKLFNDVALNDAQTENVQYAKQGTKLIDLSLKYPIVGFKEKPWADQYFKNNTHVAGMALGQGANNDYSPERTVIINPYNEYMQDPNKLRYLEFLERSRHYMNENKMYFPITLEQRDYYNQPAFENSYKGLNDTIKFQTDASRYLVGDDNLLTKEQQEYIDKMFEGVHNGEEVIITPDYEYTLFLNTLPRNLKYASEEEYPTYRYWQLHNKPKNFEEAKARKMYDWNEGDHLWHANSVVEMPDGTIEFMKPKNHPTLYMETDYYNKGIEWDNKGIPHKLIPKTAKYKKWLDFRNHYDLDSSETYYKYIPK